MSKANKQADAEPEVPASGDAVGMAFVDEPADPDIKIPDAPKDSDYATFQSLRAKDLWLTLKPNDMHIVTRNDGSSGRVKQNVSGEYPDAPFIAKFSMGKFRTNNKAVIIGMLNASTFRLLFDIDTADATGYWRRHNVISQKQVVEYHNTVEADTDKVKLLVGTISAGDKAHLAGV